MRQQTRLSPSTSNGLRGVAATLLALACLSNASAGSFTPPFKTTDTPATALTLSAGGYGAAQQPGGVARVGFQTAATNLIFTGNFAFNGWGGGNTQAYGLVLEPSADAVIVKDNILTGNTTSGLLNNGRPGPNKVVSDNLQ